MRPHPTPENPGNKVLDSLAKKGVALASPKGPRGRLSIFIFHRVKDVVDPLFVEDDESAGRFDQVLGWIGRWFQVLPLGEAVQELARGSLRERAACITFDDGYADNLHNAAPILQAHGMHATFFIATGFLDGSVMWNDRIIESVRDTSLRHIEVECLGLGTIPVGSVAEKRAALASLIPALKHRQPDERQAAVDQVVESCGRRLGLAATGGFSARCLFCHGFKLHETGGRARARRAKNALFGGRALGDDLCLFLFDPS